MNTHRATIEWIAKEKGGRITPPLEVGERPYTTVVRILNSGEPSTPDVSWSLCVRKLEVLVDPFKWIAEVCFLVDSAPHHLLSVGTDFELLEGKKCVARGRIIC